MPSISQHSPTSPLPVGVIGCGRMGKLHARVYGQMPQVRLVGVHDLDSNHALDVASEYRTRAFDQLDELLDSVQAVTIAVPTQHHLAVARHCLQRRIPCLIEKPLAKTIDEGRQIAELAHRQGVLVQVGHIERFNPAVRAMERLQIRPRYIEVVRISPLSFRSLDVGVVLDMMIHDIDIVLMLANSTVNHIQAIGVGVMGDVEDICNARLSFENGCVANLTASRLALKTERKLRVLSPETYISLDYQKREGIVAHRKGNIDAIRQTVQRIREGQVGDLSQLNYQNLVHVEELKIDDTEPLRAELDAFVEAIRAPHSPVVSAEAGLAAVELASRIVQSIAPQNLD